MTEETSGLRDKLARQGEEALGKLAQDLLENPLVASALTRAFEARERAVQAQGVAMGALNLPSAADLERLTRRIRSVAQRLEGIEDGLDRVERRLEALGGPSPGDDDRLAAIERRLAELTERVGALGSGPSGRSEGGGSGSGGGKPAGGKASSAGGRSGARKGSGAGGGSGADAGSGAGGGSGAGKRSGGGRAAAGKSPSGRTPARGN